MTDNREQTFFKMPVRRPFFACDGEYIFGQAHTTNIAQLQYSFAKTRRRFFQIKLKNTHELFAL